jgi:Ca-activated chloride channel family protein
MHNPLIELIPARPAVCSGAPVTLDVLVRITPPLPEVHFPRPPLNLGLVLDRSGSMSEGRKMPYAREAAAFVVQQLLPTDRVSLTIFDDSIDTIAPSAPAADKPRLIHRIKQIHPRGSTNLHGGWAAGARQVEEYALDTGINRVLLLSDGLANVGVTDPNTITTEARGLAARRVSTTTLGVGDNYNEDLLEAMANAGDGHYYYIESPTQLVDIFQTELQGLMATLGQRVSLGIEPQGNVTVSDVLNDLEKAPTGRLMLPNLVVGMPILVVVRLNVPPGRETSLMEVRLAWDDPQSGERRSLRARLDGFRAVGLDEWTSLPVDPVVNEQQALLMVARAQKEASRANERGNLPETLGLLSQARAYLGAVPGSPAVDDELQAIAELERAANAGDDLYMRKLAKFRAYRQTKSRPFPPPQGGTGSSEKGPT